VSVIGPVTRGVSRSLRIYYGDKARDEAMDRLHAGFVGAGDLVFDVGSHVGDRIGSFRRLGARVVGVEPQPPLHRALRLLYGKDRDVALEPVAVGGAQGETLFHLNIDNPTVSTASDAFLAAANGAPGWEGQAWTRSLSVKVDTLDNLMVRHGRPRFMKIDVEGYEAVALQGLSGRVPALSFEFTTIQRDVAFECLDRLEALGYRRFKAALGESQRFEQAEPVLPGAMRAWLKGLPHAANSGDIYALDG
jgi:FkbM family methyltransferase